VLESDRLGSRFFVAYNRFNRQHKGRCTMDETIYRGVNHLAMITDDMDKTVRF